MQQHHDRIVRRPMFNGSLRLELGGVAFGNDLFAQALQSNECENDYSRRHHHSTSVAKLAVKPGPSEPTKRRPFCLRPKALFNTNKTVGADILP